MQKLKPQILLLFFAFVTATVVYSCTNPFAPALTAIDDGHSLYSDQTTIEGVFDNFRLAYQYKDTTEYGKLLNYDFLFLYHNYDKGVDNKWGRAEDMLTTYNLFNSAQSLDLIWNSVLVSAGDSTLQEISRGFTLTIVFQPEDIVTIQGRAILTMKRDSTGEPWKISMWKDESNY